ncbi:MAG: GNAT family N-acetyltransferase [Reichenbachiella sp.]
MNEEEMHNDFIIRIATVVDLSALVKVNGKLFDHKIKPHRAKEFLEDPRHHMLIAYDNGKVVGMISAVHYVHPDKDPQLFINELGVVEEFQNQGLGRELVRHMCEHGKNLGCTEAWVATAASNEAAIKAYTAAGGIEGSEGTILFEFNNDL